MSNSLREIVQVLIGVQVQVLIGVHVQVLIGGPPVLNIKINKIE